MIKKLFLLLLAFNCPVTYAQTVKTDVLVIGGSPQGTAAAIQCARSKVKTILAADDIKINSSNDMVILNANRNIASGIWGEFRQRAQEYYKNKKEIDTAYNAALRFEPEAGVNVLKNISDTVKNLSLYLNATFTTIKKDDDRWEVNIMQNGKTVTVKARVVIDATENGDVAVKAGAKFNNEFDSYKNSDLTLYRTAIAAGESVAGLKDSNTGITANYYPPYPAWYIPINAVLLKDADNLLVTEKALPREKSIQYLPMQLALGQGTGAIAAYCAFYKTTSKNLKVRLIQGELLDFKGYLIPFADIPQKDRNWRAIQQVAATGLLKGFSKTTNNESQFVFMPDSVVETNAIKPVLAGLYARAFLWFNKEKTSELFTVGNMLSFISDYTLTDPGILNKTIQKEWKTQYKFKLDFDLKRPVTRREFAVLANKFLNPFARTVDLSGRAIN